MLRRRIGSVLLGVLLSVSLLPGCSETSVAPGVAKGFQLCTYRDYEGNESKYVLFVPFEYSPDRQMPLLVFLNGQGENGTDGVTAAQGPLGTQIWDLKASFPFVTVFLQCRIGHSWLNADEAQRGFAIIEEVERKYNTDSDRVYLTGVSSGGAGAWHIAATEPHRFAALVPLCGVAEIPETARILAEANLPIWSFCKSDDEPRLVGVHQRMYQSLLDRGASPRYTEVPGTGHDCWNFAYRNVALYEWLLRQSRSSNSINRKEFVTLLNAEGLNLSSVPPEMSWNIDSEGLGIAPASIDGRFLVTKKCYDDYELHFEIMLDGVSECVMWLKWGSELGCLNGVGLKITFSEFGSGGLFHASEHNWICPADAIAQRALLRNDWNDVRIRCVAGHVQAELNGFTLLNVQDIQNVRRRAPIALEVPPSSEAIKCRHLRICEIGKGSFAKCD